MRLKSQCNCRKTVRKQVDKQQVHRSKGHGKRHNRSVQDRQYGPEVPGKKKLNGVFYVLVYISSIFHCLNNSGKVIIRQYHRRGILGNFASCNPHCHANIRLLQCRSIVHAVSGHGHNIPLFLPCTDNPYLMFRGYPGIYRYALNKVLQLFIVHSFNHSPLAGLSFFLQNPDPLCYGRRCNLVIAGDHNRFNSRPDTFGNSLRRLFPGGIHHGDQSDKCKVFFIFQRQGTALLKLLARKCQHSQSPSGEFLVLGFYGLSVFRCEGLYTAVLQNMCHSVQKDIHSTFSHHGISVLQHMCS